MKASPVRQVQAVHRKCMDFFSVWTGVEALYDEKTSPGRDFAEEFVRDVATHLFSDFLPIAHDMVEACGVEAFQISNSDMLLLASGQAEDFRELLRDPRECAKNGRRLIAWSFALHPNNVHDNDLAAQYENGLFRLAKELTYDEIDNHPYGLRWRLWNQPLIFAFREFNRAANLDSFPWKDTPFWQHHGSTELREKANHKWTLDFRNGEIGADAPALEEVESRYRETMEELQIGPDREWLPSLNLDGMDIWWNARLARHQGRAAAHLPDATVSAEEEGGSNKSIAVSRYGYDIPRRPCAGRDHEFLFWYEAEGTDTHHSPAKIRDKWNGTSDDERSSICESALVKISANGSGTIKQALRKATKERDNAKKI